MKYLLISQQTGEETLCDKVTIDGFDYYVSDELPKDNEGYWIYVGFNHPIEIVKSNQPHGWFQKLWDKGNYKTPIATNNPNLDIPQIVDDVEMLAKQNGFNWENTETSARRVFEKWYKSQETHPFSEEDVRFMLSVAFKASQEGYQITSDEIIQLWKEQRTKKVYYTQAAQP